MTITISYLIFRQLKTAEDVPAPYKSEQKVLVGNSLILFNIKARCSPKSFFVFAKKYSTSTLIILMTNATKLKEFSRIQNLNTYVTNFVFSKLQFHCCKSFFKVTLILIKRCQLVKKSKLFELFWGLLKVNVYCFLNIVWLSIVIF